MMTGWTEFILKHFGKTASL